jgi:hypothetical protein
MEEGETLPQGSSAISPRQCVDASLSDPVE